MGVSLLVPCVLSFVFCGSFALFQYLCFFSPRVFVSFLMKAVLHFVLGQ